MVLPGLEKVLQTLNSNALHMIFSVLLLAPGHLLHAQPDGLENLRLSDDVANIVVRYNDCLALEDFSCALSHLEDLNALELSEFEQSRYWNMLAWISFLSGDLETALEGNLKVADYTILPTRMRLYSLRTAAQLLAGMERYQEAYETLELWLELEGDSNSLYRERASELAKAGSYLEAYELLERPIGFITGIAIEERHHSTESLWRDLGLYVGVSSDVLLKAVPKPALETDEQRGYVVLEFTVNRIGKTENIKIVEMSSTMLEQIALDAAAELRYRPKVENRRAVATEGVRYRFEF